MEALRIFHYKTYTEDTVNAKYKLNPEITRWTLAKNEQKNPQAHYCCITIVLYKGLTSKRSVSYHCILCKTVVQSQRSWQLRFWFGRHSAFLKHIIRKPWVKKYTVLWAGHAHSNNFSKNGSEYLFFNIIIGSGLDIPVCLILSIMQVWRLWSKQHKGKLRNCKILVWIWQYPLP